MYMYSTKIQNRLHVNLIMIKINERHGQTYSAFCIISTIKNCANLEIFQSQLFHVAATEKNH